MENDEYLKLARVEDRMWYFRALHTHVWRELARRHDPGRAAEMLDAGCGTGGLIRRLAPRAPAWRWHGVDLLPLACELARERGVADVRQAALEALPWNDGEFEAVVSADVLYHLDDDAAGLRELARVLRPGGTLVVNVPAYPWLWSYHDAAVHSRRRYGRRELTDKIAAAGLASVRSSHWNALPFPVIVLRRKVFSRGADSSDVRLHAPPVEMFFRALMAAEQAWLRLGGTWAWGSSILAVAQKPA